MNRWQRYLIEVLAFAIGIAAIVKVPDIALTIEVILLPCVLVGSALAVIYLKRILDEQPPPRSRFFRMLVAVSTRKVLMSTWIGYLTVGRIGQNQDWFHLPLPPPETAAPITGLVLLVFLGAPIAYALTVYIVRRRSLVGDSAATRQEDLDREQPFLS